MPMVLVLKLKFSALKALTIQKEGILYMKKWFTIIASIFACFILSVILVIYIYGPNINVYLLPPSPKKYGKIAIQKMDRYGYFTKSDTWQKAKKKALEDMNTVHNYGQADAILQKIIKIAGGKHSQIMTTKQITTEAEQYEEPTITNNDGLVTIHEPQFQGNTQQANEYANKINDFLFKYKDEIKSVIIDLSNNNGGDMAPMILGIASIIPDGHILSFVSQNGTTEKISLKNGMINAGGTSIDLNHNIKLAKIPVAVIINKQTASSGELTALALKKVSNVKYFGQNSASFTSVNRSVPLYTGTTMYLTTAGVKDSKNKLYINDPIVPDIQTNDAYGQAKQWTDSFN
ncbi:S41 family peptidase [Leuconostoc mesenteroides]